MATLAYSVRQAVKSAGADPRDQAAIALALNYARLIDNAAPAAKYAAALRWLAGVHVEDPAQEHLREIIEVALAAHTVASDLGPKLLTALEALILSPRARAAVKKAVTISGPTVNPLDQLAAARARLGPPQAMDTAAS